MLKFMKQHPPNEIAVFEKRKVFASVKSWIDLTYCEFPEVELFGCYAISILSFKKFFVSLMEQGRFVERVLSLAVTTSDRAMRDYLLLALKNIGPESIRTCAFSLQWKCIITVSSTMDKYPHQLDKIPIELKECIQTVHQLIQQNSQIKQMDS